MPCWHGAQYHFTGKISMDDNAAYGRGNGFHYALPEERSSGHISRRHLHDELLTRLRGCIIGGEFEPGEKIPEKELCERFGVSRTPLREALKVLAFEGLVVLHHNRGSAVSPLNVQDLAEAFPVYARFEALAGELACDRLDTAEINAIRRLHDEMVAHYVRGDYRAHFMVNEQIHQGIQAGSKNRNLIQLLRSISSRVAQARHHVMLSGERWDNAIAEHEAIIAALEAHDGPRLSRLLREHMESTFRAITETLMEGRGPPTP
jgi:DNA-binding GntR family transcriptional regulator